MVAGSSDHDDGGEPIFSMWPRLLGLIVLHAALIGLKFPDLVHHPRLWAEEGQLYLQNAILFEGRLDVLLRY